VALQSTTTIKPVLTKNKATTKQKTEKAQNRNVLQPKYTYQNYKALGYKALDHSHEYLEYG
jgi:hypothetical protein